MYVIPIQIGYALVKTLPLKRHKAHRDSRLKMAYLNRIRKIFGVENFLISFHTATALIT